MTGEHCFQNAMAQAGLDCKEQLINDGKPHRFRAESDHKKNSWYILAPDLTWGAFGCFKRGIDETWHCKNRQASTIDQQERRRKLAEARAALERETAARQAKAGQTAEWIVRRSEPVKSNAYLTVKRVKAHGELRQRGNLLVLPLRDTDGQLHSVQFVSHDGEKRFLTGGRITGCSFTIGDNGTERTVICEGLATGASIYEATGHTIVCAMNAGNLKAVAESFRTKYPDHEIIIAADNDQWTDENPGLTKASQAAQAIRAKLAVPRFKDVTNKPTDFNDLHQQEGLQAVKSQIDSAALPTESDADTFQRLASLSPADYDRARKAEAKRLGIQTSTLDSEVAKLRSTDGGNLQGCAIDLPNVEPWPEPVIGSTVLQEISDTFSRFLALPSGAADAMALWVAHAHCLDCFEHSPRLCYTAPEKGCGKTTARDVTAQFVPRPLSAENLTPAVLFRVIESHRPTILADEYDAWLRDNEELRGLFNAGHKRGGQALRCEGQDNTVRAFRVFGAVVLSGIGALPGTLYDRSIVIPLVRARPGEVTERFDSRRVAGHKDSNRKLARWIADNATQIERCDPILPDGAFNRMADNWRPLFAIAETAGGDWPNRAAAAFTALTATDDHEAQGIGAMLLADIAEAFKSSNTDKFASVALANALSQMEGRPWAEFGKSQKPITANQLAKQLHKFGISPKPVRFGSGPEDVKKGYCLADFSEAFDRYLGKTSLSNGYTVTTPVNIGDSGDFKELQPESLLPMQNSIFVNKDGHCNRVTDGKPTIEAELTL